MKLSIYLLIYIVLVCVILLHRHVRQSLMAIKSVTVLLQPFKFGSVRMRMPRGSIWAAVVSTAGAEMRVGFTVLVEVGVGPRPLPHMLPSSHARQGAMIQITVVSTRLPPPSPRTTTPREAQMKADEIYFCIPETCKTWIV